MALNLLNEKPKITLYCDDRFIRISNAKYKPMSLNEFKSMVKEVKRGFFLSKTVRDDIKKCVNFDLENCTSTSLYGKTTDKQKLINYQNIGDFCFKGYTAGGDWEHPLFFIVYFDGNEFRGYVPTCGNTFYLPEKAAFGSTDAGQEEIAEYIQKEFPQYSKEEAVDIVRYDNFYFDFSWIRKDIIAHFQIKDCSE